MGRRSRYWAARGMYICWRVCEKEKMGRRKLSSLPVRKMTMIRNAHVDRGERVPISLPIPSLNSDPTIRYPPFFPPTQMLPNPIIKPPNSLPSNPQCILKSPPRSPIPPHIETFSEYTALHLDTALADVVVLVSVPAPAFSLVLWVISIS